MLRRRAPKTLLALSVLLALAATTTAAAQELPEPVEDALDTVGTVVGDVAGAVEDLTQPQSASYAGGTEPVYGYLDAIRERVFVQSDFDSDADGISDTIAMDIIRPLATDTEGLKVPVIMDASPYYSTVCRGNEAECKSDVENDGALEKFPLFYDNYFVPRGYAVVLLDMVGTNNSDGCPVTGGTPDNLSAVVGIDWLNGRRAGEYMDGSPAVADWHNGKTGMIGKSYDGTLANAAAATGVEGLTTIVPISAISNWYFYTRMNGVVTRTGSYPSSLSNTVTDADRRTYCAPTRNAMAANDGDETGDYTPFWAERDYLPSSGNVQASVFVTHGLQDDNVRTNNFSEWWYDLAERDVPRKLWLTGTGHVDPFDFRREVWVETLHKWFDFWLYGIENDVMDQPMVDIETAADVWETQADWPVPGTEMFDIYLRPGASETTNGRLTITQGTAPATTSFTDSTGQSESTMINNETTVTANRRVFLSDPLEAPLRVSGTPYVKLIASVNRTDTNLGGILVDYGAGTHISRSGEGITTLMTESCYGEDSPTDDACYRDVAKATTTAASWRVGKGILDAVNRDSLSSPTDLTIDQPDDFTWDLLSNDYTFPAGHRIGVVIVGSYTGFSSTTDPSGATITLDLQRSKITLPIVGGYAGAAAPRGFADENAPVVAVPDDIVVESESPEGTVVTYEAGVDDAEDPAPTVECDPPSGSSFPVGTTTVTCTGRDGYGNETTETFMVTVEPWEFTGFFAPVENRPAVNDRNGGSAVPIKFSLGGDRGMDIFAPGFPASRPIDCVTGQALGDPEAATSTSGLMQTGDRYHYNWKTEALWAGTCREFILGLADGSDHTALFRIT